MATPNRVPGYPSQWSAILKRGVEGTVNRKQRFEYRDIRALTNRIDQLSVKLFGSEIDCDICEVTEKGISPKQIRSESELNEYLEKTDETIAQAQGSYNTQILYFYQTHSWGRLLASEACFQKVISNFDTFPDFLDVLTSFGSKDGPIDEIHSSYKFATFTEPPRIPGRLRISFFSECCYVLKYVDLHNRLAEKDRPWSIRQIGVYQKYDHDNDRGTCILIQPPTSLTDTLSNVLGDPQEADLRKVFCLDWTKFHLRCLGAIRDHWRDYINSLDAKVISMAGRLRFSKVDEKGILNRNHQQFAAFSNLQDLEEINDELLRIRHVLDLNITVMEAMKSHLDDLDPNMNPSQMNLAIRTFREAIDIITIEFKFHIKATSSVYERSARILSTLRDAITIQDSHTMKILALIRNEGNIATEKLTWETIRETRTMKILAILALVFLPATFTSGLFSMGYISVSSVTNGLLKVQVQNEFYLFLAITFSLMVATIGTWVAWELNQSRKTKNPTQNISANISLGA
ncbi:hypothetical protein H072_10700 [Dactylellina haptotyla CBS 200.50]|uniref:CorA-like transporter domain-containing protein n=1 Tax=Dactylellina haptotyla (strain CBS 200.50) TaxID=1284197 RepID=S7ZZB3_DACHA|nr:hypothetical protein H072_10700 [Dactylellina haptotyla CBS 200.50]